MLTPGSIAPTPIELAICEAAILQPCETANLQICRATSLRLKFEIQDYHLNQQGGRRSCRVSLRPVFSPRGRAGEAVIGFNASFTRSTRDRCNRENQRPITHLELETVNQVGMLQTYDADHSLPSADLQICPSCLQHQKGLAAAISKTYTCV